MRGAAAALAALMLAAGCGGEESEAPHVFAASSLTEVFRAVAPDGRFTFAGSGELARQIEQGAEPDVYASADPGYALRLWRTGLLERPRILAANQVVLIVPRANPARIRGLSDLARREVKLVIGAEGVPVGDYTRQALARSAAGRAALRNVVSEEPDARGVVAKVALGEADAGFAYVTDARAARNHIRTVYPAIATTVYAIAAVEEGNAEAASDFIALALGHEGQAALLRAGFVTTNRRGDPMP